MVAVALAGCGTAATTPTSTPATAPAVSTPPATSTTSAKRRHHATPRHRPHHAVRARHSATGLAYSTASNDVVQPQPAAGSCHALGSGAYERPDPSCTPGALNPAVTQGTIDRTICVSGWTERVRPPESVTEQEKAASIVSYAAPGSLGDYEYDHFVPLELGGATNDHRNLWPEPGESPNPKDTVEDELNHEVCDGQISLIHAQHEIVSNWAALAPHPSARAPKRATCSVTASYNSSYHDYDVYVHSNQPDQTVTVTGSDGESKSWHTDGGGYADVYFHGASGERITVHVGGAVCTGTL